MWARLRSGKPANRQADRQGGKATLDIAHSRCLIHS